jgi:hypothetical protein
VRFAVPFRTMIKLSFSNKNKSLDQITFLSEFGGAGEEWRCSSVKCDALKLFRRKKFWGASRPPPPHLLPLPISWLAQYTTHTDTFYFWCSGNSVRCSPTRLVFDVASLRSRWANALHVPGNVMNECNKILRGDRLFVDRKQINRIVCGASLLSTYMCIHTDARMSEHAY